tara:strand:- start:172 stop:1482 length:1311 start_codon:yes stop_codon:yes gene_type:complete
MISSQENINQNNFDNKNKDKNNNLPKKFKQFSYLSYEINKLLNLNTKKENGIYFTPSNIIQICLNEILEYSRNNNLIIKNILEPCCGSCEFICAVDNFFNNTNIIGIENNDIIYNKIKDLKLNNNKLSLINKNFFDSNLEKFDLVIGNPPFYIISKNNISNKYHKFFDGRPNIFLLFIIDSLKKLNDNGLLCFVLPVNFLNCIYYDKLRNFINCNYYIINIINCETSNFIDTQQETIILILQKTKYKFKNEKFSLPINNYCIFNDQNNINFMKKLLNNSKSLYSLGFDVKVGNIVWNEKKNLLTDDSSKTILIYNANIKNNKFEIQEFKNINKKNYINIKGKKDTVLLLNRGYGKGNYIFNYYIADLDQEYLIENHLIYIFHKKITDKNKLIEYFNIIIKSFQDERTKNFISIYFGNNAINTNELKHILPIYNFNL